MDITKMYLPIPGKVTDSKSAGCNYLIKSNKAMLLTDAQQLTRNNGMGGEKPKAKSKKSKEIFIELSQRGKIIIDILQ